MRLPKLSSPSSPGCGVWEALCQCLGRERLEKNKAGRPGEEEKRKGRKKRERKVEEEVEGTRMGVGQRERVGQTDRRNYMLLCLRRLFCLENGNQRPFP